MAFVGWAKYRRDFGCKWAPASGATRTLNRPNVGPTVSTEERRRVARKRLSTGRAIRGEEQAGSPSNEIEHQGHDADPPLTMPFVLYGKPP